MNYMDQISAMVHKPPVPQAKVSCTWGRRMNNEGDMGGQPARSLGATDKAEDPSEEEQEEDTF